MSKVLKEQIEAIAENVRKVFEKIKTDFATKKELEEAIENIPTGEGGTIVVDQTYNPKSENAQSGKAVAEAIAGVDGTYELIETITLEEDVTSITRNTEPNGNAYSFKDVYVRFNWAESIPNNKWIQLTVRAGGVVSNAFRTYLGAGATCKSWIKTLCHYGQRFFVLSDSSSNIGYANNFAYIPISILETDAPIDSITISHETGMPVGTKIYIYGVRA